MRPFPLVPAPVSVSTTPGELAADRFRLAGDNADTYRQAVLSAFGDGRLGITEDKDAPTLTLLEASGLDIGPAGYELEIDDNVAVRANSREGILHGLATLAQLGLNNTLPKVTIKDTPRYGWRGLSLDVVRHWYGLDAIYDVIDILAAYKFNILHLHLTDDQGWRIEIPAYPALTEKASRSQVGGPLPEQVRGYMTLQEYQELQKYAASKGITIVPEVDLPGHINAALHAIPELNPDGIAPEPNYGIEVGISQLRVDNPATAPFINEVIKTFCEWTVGDWVHIGGDEVPNLTKEEYQQLVAIANNAVIANGKKTIAWQDAAVAAEYLQENSQKDSELPVLQYWTPQIDLAQIARAGEQGYRVILSPADRIYLDMKYDENDPLGLTWIGHTNLEKARNWEPSELLPGFPADQILGMEGALWSETCRAQSDMLSLLFPRLAAVADLAWAAPGAAADFPQRVAAHGELWKRWGVPQISIDRLAA
jgi:hexosaminidase